MSFTDTVGGTTVQVDGDLNPRLPLVILLHGNGGTSLDMTDPATGRRGLAFDRTAPPPFPLWRSIGFFAIPPALPVFGFAMDPDITPLTSWKKAFNNAGFSTLSYTQVSGSISGLLAPDVTQLGNIITQVLTANVAHPEVNNLRLVFVAHSRGGLLARLFLIGAPPAVIARVVAVVTLHSPHLGSGIANTAPTITPVVVALQLAFRGLPINLPINIEPEILEMLRIATTMPSLSELAIGNPVLTALAATEAVATAPGGPLAGVSYHTFGGTSTLAGRLWADVITPESFIPLPLPFPMHHWAATPVPVGVPMDPATFAPGATLGVPVLTEIATLLATLAATTPEMAHGSGDWLVANARAHLPFSLTRTANPLNHAEALWDKTLQAQVLAILERLRAPPIPKKRMKTSVTPYPVPMNRDIRVTIFSTDDTPAATPVQGTVFIRNDFGVPNKFPSNIPFTWRFIKRREAHTGEWKWTRATVEAPGYNTAGVDFGIEVPI